MYITVAFCDDLECELFHVLSFLTTDFQTRSNTVKALLITQLLTVPFTSQSLFFLWWIEGFWCSTFPSVTCSSFSTTLSAAGWLESTFPNKHSTAFWPIIFVQTGYQYGSFRLPGPNSTRPALKASLSSGPKPLNELAASEELLQRKATPLEKTPQRNLRGWKTRNLLIKWELSVESF